jgi:hypothetical protein
MPAVEFDLLRRIASQGIAIRLITVRKYHFVPPASIRDLAAPFARLGCAAARPTRRSFGGRGCNRNQEQRQMGRSS